MGTQRPAKNNNNNNGVHVVLHFHKQDGVDRNLEQADVEQDPDEEDMEDVKLDKKSEHHWRMVFEDNDGGVGNQKSVLHAKRWDVYINEKEVLIKGGY